MKKFFNHDYYFFNVRFIPLRSNNGRFAYFLMHGSTQKFYDNKHPLYKIVEKLPGDIYSVELPGHGKNRLGSPLKPEEYVNLFLNEFKEKIDSLNKKVRIIGYSLGGLLGLKTLELKNDKIDRVIGIATGLYIGREEMERIRIFFTKDTYRALNYDKEMIKLHGRKGWEVLMETLHELFYPGSPIFVDKEKIRNTPTKALVILGDKDEAFTATKMKKTYREYFNVDLVVLENIGHFDYFVKAVDDLYKIINQFFQERS